MMTPSFSKKELECKCGCGLARFHPGFLNAIQGLRDELGLPMTLTSACRCAKHNAAEGGKPKSFHIGDEANHNGQEGAMAIDVATPNGEFRGKLFAIAWARGFSVGWNAKKGFLHLDLRTELGLQQTTFDY